MWRLRCSRRVCHLCPTLGEDVVVHSKHNRVYGTPQLASNTLIVVSNTLWLIEARGYDLMGTPKPLDGGRRPARRPIRSRRAGLLGQPRDQGAEHCKDCTVGLPDTYREVVSCPINSRPKTGRESTSCGVTNPHQVFNLVPVRALPEADFAGFPTNFAPSASALDQAFWRAIFIPRINGTGH